MYMPVRPAASQFLPRFIVRFTMSESFCPQLMLLMYIEDADIVCSRAKNHYDPQGTIDFSDSATNNDSAQAETTLEAFRKNFKPLNEAQKKLMYFSVSFLFTTTAICYCRLSGFQ